MDTRYLKSFVAVVEDGSIASASRRLNLTPGAVSQRLKALEHEIGTRLVVRSGRSVRPTDAGVFIVDDARNIVRDAENLRQSLARKTRGCSFRMGAIPSAAASLMPDLLTHLAREHPEVEVSLTCGDSAKLHKLVFNQELDAAITLGQPHLLLKSYKWAALRKQRLLLLASITATATTVHDLLHSRPLIRYGHDGVALLGDIYLCQLGLRPRVLTELDSLDAIERLVAADLGVSLLPDWIAPSAHLTARWPIDGPDHRHEVGVLWSHGSARTLILQSLLERLTCILQPTVFASASTPAETSRILPFRPSDDKNSGLPNRACVDHHLSPEVSAIGREMRGAK